MTLKFLITALIWGFILWLIGYIPGIVLFTLVPASSIGWIIMPVGILITLWVLYKKINFKTLREYIFLGIIWAIIAILCDYFLLVKMFNPAEGYYKLDVYLYYVLTFTLPAVAGYMKTRKKN